jgi:hypothetical protein
MNENLWTSNQMIALYIALGVVLGGVIAWLLMRKTVRTRLSMAQQLRRDPDINDWLIIFGWTSKVLYVPTMAAALLASVLMFLHESGWSLFAGIDPKLVGGVWFAIFFVNYLVEEYELSLKVLIIWIVGFGFLLLWLHLLGWVTGFLGLFKHLAFSISGTGYLLVALIGLLTLFLSWLNGLFHYVAFTPNYLNLKVGLTEAGEQIAREDYNTRIDTGDFLERLLGFGRIIISFKDNRRPPVILLVWRVDRKAETLECVRAKFAIDHPQRSGLVDISPPPPAPPLPPPEAPRVENPPAQSSWE